jgi:hypothetical protein
VVRGVCRRTQTPATPSEKIGVFNAQYRLRCAETVMLFLIAFGIIVVVTCVAIFPLDSAGWMSEDWLREHRGSITP